ncbi:MAG: glycosyltransferase family 2 protein [Actinomycetota bacterium]
MSESTPIAGWRNDPAWPDVDVVMPVRNEADHLARAMTSIRAQNYPGRVRVFVAVAPSADDTARIAAEFGDDVTVVPNPAGVTPAGLNAAIRAGASPVVVRVDGHSRLSEGYIRRAVATLRRTDAGNVGGMQVPEPETRFEAAVAAATTSWLGTGGATYRLGGEEGPTDTVYLGVFDRTALQAAGLFDERLIRNQDYELNIRLRASGHEVWFDPELAVGYRPRGTWRSLARQYYEYGYWKSVVLRMHPQSVRVRQIVPPVGLGVAAVLAAAVIRRPRWAIAPAAGLCALIGAAAKTARASAAPTFSVVLVTALVPTAWALGSVHAALTHATAWRTQPPR